MSRLQKHEQKQFLTTIAFFVVIIIVVVVFIFTVGIKLLFNTALFVANLTAKKTAPSTLIKADDTIRNVDITDIPSATNSANLIVQGEILNFDSLQFYINDEKVKTVSISSSDSFSQEIGELKKGSNDVYVIALSAKDNQKKESTHYPVVYMSEKPKLDISAPGDNSKTNKQEITVSGSTDKEVFVKVNDQPVVVDANGTFQTTVKLNDGDNKITVSVLDIAGNTDSKIITVNYNKDN